MEGILQDLRRMIENHLSQSLIVRDVAGLVVSWNSEAQRLHGWSAIEARGRNAQHLLKSRHSLPMLLAERDLQRTGSWIGEVIRTTKDGSEVCLSIVWINVQIDGNAFVIELGQERPPRPSLNIDKPSSPLGLSVQAGFVRSACNTTLNELLSVMAHDANQPLAALSVSGQTISRWIDRPLPDLQEVRILANQMADDAQRVSAIIARTRQMATYRSGQFEHLSIDAVVLDSIQLVREDLMETGVELGVTLSCNLPPFLGCRLQMQQVMVILAINAMQAMIRTARAKRAIQISTASGRNGTVEVIVADTGPGVSAAIRSNLFSGVLISKESGSGIGLAVCRSIMQAHGGAIALQESQVGARFHLTLPALGSPDSAHEEA
jgi:PAS domain S-box-containing protein